MLDSYIPQVFEAPYFKYVKRVAAQLQDEAPKRPEGFPAVRHNFAYVALVNAVSAFDRLFAYPTNPIAEPTLALGHDIEECAAEDVVRFILGYWLWLICSEGNGRTRTVWGTPGTEFYIDVAALLLLTDGERKNYKELDELYGKPGHPVLVWEELIQRAGGNPAVHNMIESMAAATYLKDSAEELMRQFAETIRRRGTSATGGR